MESYKIIQLTNQDNIPETIANLINNNNYIIQLEPGIYQDLVDIPSGIVIRGSGKELTKIILNESITIYNQTQLQDLTIEFSNTLLQDDLYLLTIKADNRDFAHYINLTNINIELYNFIGGKVFNVLGGIITLKEVSISNKLLEEEIESVSNNILFYGIYFAEINLVRCHIDYETLLGNTFLFYSELTKINIQDSNLILNSKEKLPNTFLFYLNYSHLIVNNSMLENRIESGQLLWLDNSESIIPKQVISNLRIEKNNLYIRSYLRDSIYNKIILFLKGIRYQKNNYIFNYSQEYDTKIVISLHLSSSNKSVDYLLEPEVEYLFQIDIKNTLVRENSELGLLDSILKKKNYLTNLQNINLETANFSGLVSNSLLYNYQTQELSTYQINLQNYNNILGKDILSYQKGYSLLEKEEIGFYSLDLSTGDSKNSARGIFSNNFGHNNSTIGDFGTTLGINNITEGLESISIGSNLKNNYHKGICLGYYNKETLLDKLLVVGNGTSDKRSNALLLDKNGNLCIKNSITSKILTDGKIRIEDGNITNVSNLEVLDNIYVDQDLYVEGELRGLQIEKMDILNISGTIITTIKIDLSNYKSPKHYGCIIGHNNGWIPKLDTHNGLIYRTEITCLETPNRTDIRFILSNLQNLRVGCQMEKLSEYKKENHFELAASYEWCRGKRVVEEELFKLDYNYGLPEMNLYLVREVNNSNYQEIGELNLTGKFMVKIIGIEN